MIQAILVTLLIVGFLTSGVRADEIGRAAAPDDESEAPLRLAASLYYTSLQQDYPAGTDAPFRDREGNILAHGSQEFLAAASIEGTALFSDGLALNYDVRIGEEVRWKPVETAFGHDARGCELVPLRSAAVDPEIVSLGSLLMIPGTVGLPLPDGSLHDGLWLATDTGDSIVGARIDLFAGRGVGAMERFETFGIGYLHELDAAVLARDLPCHPDLGPNGRTALEKLNTNQY